MRALEILKEYKDIDWGCNMDYHIKLCDEAINELEAMQERSCESCKWDDIPFPNNKFHCDECKWQYFVYNDNWEAKDEPVEYSRELAQDGSPIPYVKEQ